MNHTTWLKREFPHLDITSSAQTYKLITRARHASRYSRFFMTLVIYLGVIALAEVAGGSRGIGLYQGGAGWLLAIVSFTLAGILGEFATTRLVRHKLRKQVTQSGKPGGNL